MSNALLGMMIGGLVPALLFGLFAVFTKASSQHLLATSPYLVLLGLSIAAVGVLRAPILGTGLSTLSPTGVGFGIVAGLLGGIAMLLVSFRLEPLPGCRGTPSIGFRPLRHVCHPCIASGAGTGTRGLGGRLIYMTQVTSISKTLVAQSAPEAAL